MEKEKLRSNFFLALKKVILLGCWFWCNFAVPLLLISRLACYTLEGKKKV